MPAHEALGVGLRPLEGRPRAPRPETRQAHRLEIIHDPGAERSLGAHDGKVYAIRNREAQEPRKVLGRDRDVLRLGLGGRPGIAGRHIDLGNARRLGELPAQGVLAATAADHQDLQPLR